MNTLSQVTAKPTRLMFSTVRCKICLAGFPSTKSLVEHIAKVHKMSLNEYLNFKKESKS